MTLREEILTTLETGQFLTARELEQMLGVYSLSAIRNNLCALLKEGLVESEKGSGITAPMVYRRSARQPVETSAWRQFCFGVAA